ncbi:5-formyltetrahydrofolate cyclo-ligase [Natrialba swarupiae]|uniref:5-formyltetrahydrofolate cyclo-ligase n=1 Tax=Natrialba swarupiae TaxID=2448032 RepID=A0A5D5AN86_9EURY|nr:5-formyltetrahydrofolate cyclo-ligase [Natrialba swarupiae]TYT63319.1 5-formyltetrahydrofolate cyclo-ligase [Natrialba swarupiae]
MTSETDDDAEKEAIRERVWDDLEESATARFPFPPHGRIPNFAGAKEAVERLADQPEWEEATTIKTNPDAPQLPVRRRALRDGKTVYMAVPRLRDERCFLELDPDVLEDYDEATTVSGSAKHGVQVGPDALAPIDLIVAGSVAVADGGRIGKGEGYSDLEYAICRELDLVDETTPVATTVHERQLVDDDLEFDAHDVPMDLVITPERTIRPDGDAPPGGIDWRLLDERRLTEIPILSRLRKRQS